ncbi:DUF1688 family protein [Fluviispira vulneris]|uniref:DUF1688 family protein n=1 Tax=Fluviispira vulneris TaxID=2763012 RepID=UPI001C9478C6|nr:DUF1688 family protein [Fluviispira vulneris]
MSDNMIDYSGDINDIEYIFSPATIRKKSLEIYNLTIADKTQFQIHLDKIDEVSKFVIDVTLSNYPKLNIPFHSRWNHFNVGNIDRVSELILQLEKQTPSQQTKAKLDLVVVSVLLDAGAGMRWRYLEQKSGKEYSRSEGLAVASFRLFLAGFFSADKKSPLRVDAERLLCISEKELADGLQVTEKNPIIGLQGRLKLLHNLGHALHNDVDLFGTESQRIGNMLDYFQEKSPSGKISATFILRTLQQGLGSIWPGRATINQVNIGDVWNYKALGEGIQALVPFHKLSQWLSYSLFEPLTEAGLSITQIDSLTGLAEYRNGGLILDSGLITLKNKEELEKVHLPSSDLIIEWRALTITFLDEIGKKVTEILGKKPSEFPLARVLEGGTWWAGRKMAEQMRKDKSPPLKINSDGTVF